MERMKLSAECTSTSLDDEDHLVITIDVLTESILADSRRSGRLSGSLGLEGPRSNCRFNRSMQHFVGTTLLRENVFESKE